METLLVIQMFLTGFAGMLTVSCLSASIIIKKGIKRVK